MEKSQIRRKEFIPRKNVHSEEKISFRKKKVHSEGKKSDQNKKNQRQNQNRDLFNGKTTICVRKTK